MLKGHEKNSVNKHSLQVVLASVFGINGKWMFIDNMVNTIPEDNNPKNDDSHPSATIDLLEPAPGEHDVNYTLNSEGQISLDNKGVWVDDLFFLKNEKDRQALEKRLYDWKLAHTCNMSRDNDIEKRSHSRSDSQYGKSKRFNLNKNT